MKRNALQAALVVLMLSGVGAGGGAAAKDAKPSSNAMQVAKSESVLSMRVDGEMVITPDGQVGEYRITTKSAPDEVKSLIEKSIAAWRFEPVKDDQENPVTAKTYMRMTVVARQLEGGDYSAKVENVRFHDGVKTSEEKAVRERAKEAGVEVVQRARPNYPPMMLANGVAGAALVNIQLSSEGKVTDAVVVQSAMFNVKGHSDLIEKAFAEMEREAVRSAMRMRVKFGDKVDPKDREMSSGTFAINFSMMGKSEQSDSLRRAGVWRIEQRGPLRTPSWEIEKAGVRVGISDMDGSEGYMSGAASAIKPVSGVPVL